MIWVLFSFHQALPVEEVYDVIQRSDIIQCEMWISKIQSVDCWNYKPARTDTWDVQGLAGSDLRPLVWISLTLNMAKYIYKAINQDVTCLI